MFGQHSERLETMGTSATHQIQNRHLHHALVEVCCAVLDDFDSDNFLGFHVLAFHDLAESALAKNIQDQISVPRQKSLATALPHSLPLTPGTESYL